MRILPKYSIDAETVDLLAKIEAIRIYFSSIDIPFEVKSKIKRASILASSLYSARIEGNPLELDELGRTGDKIRKKEIFNILAGIGEVEKLKKGDKIESKLMLRLHKLVMAGVGAEAGLFRKDSGAIFNQAGVAVYLPPPPFKIKKLMESLYKYINSDKERFFLIGAFIAHLRFEKIHPFLDGNGRVGRLLIQAILRVKGYDSGFVVALEEYIDEHRDSYYYYLDIGYKKPDKYLKFMLTAFLKQLEKIKVQIEELDKKEELLLPLRQEEIYLIISDHKMASFDFIKRRFGQVPARTLRYDLKKLVDCGLIIKIGVTKGSLYKVKE